MMFAVASYTPSQIEEYHGESNPTVALGLVPEALPDFCSSGGFCVLQVFPVLPRVRQALEGLVAAWKRCF